MICIFHHHINVLFWLVGELYTYHFLYKPCYNCVWKVKIFRFFSHYCNKSGSETQHEIRNNKHKLSKNHNFSRHYCLRFLVKIELNCFKNFLFCLSSHCQARVLSWKGLRITDFRFVRRSPGGGGVLQCVHD